MDLNFWRIVVWSWYIWLPLDHDCRRKVGIRWCALSECCSLGWRRLVHSCGMVGASLGFIPGGLRHWVLGMFIQVGVFPVLVECRKWGYRGVWVLPYPGWISWCVGTFGGSQIGYWYSFCQQALWWFFCKPIWSILIKFDPIYSNLIQFSLLYSNLIKFEPIWSNLIQFEPIYSNLIKFDQLDQVWSNLFYFIPIWSSLIQFEPIYSN